MRVLFSEWIARSRALEGVYRAARALGQLRLDDLPFGYGRQQQGFRRLFFSQRQLPLWRYRHGNERVILWAGLLQHQETAILWLAGHRREVYEQLGRKLGTIYSFPADEEAFEQWEEALDPPPQDLDYQALVQTSPWFRLPERLGSPEALASYLREGIFRFQPLLTEVQAALARNVDNIRWRPFAPLIVPVQGGAGTGKTSLAVEMAGAFLRVAQEVYPILVLPTATLARKAQAALLAHHPHSRLAQTWPDHTHTQALVTTRDDLIQALAAAGDPPMPLGECNRRLRQYLTPRLGSWDLSGNLYGILRGYSDDPEIAYPSSYRDVLTAHYQHLKDRIQRVWGPAQEGIFENRDPYAQAQGAWAAVQGLQPAPGTRRYVLILDEVQDYYWFQLRVLVALAQRLNVQPLLVLLGDENQRVTISGFTWAALARVMQEQVGILLPQRVQLWENFRNSQEIARVARHVLLQGFGHLLPLRKSRRWSDPGVPSCTHGPKPRLQVIAKDEEFWQQLPALMTRDPELDWGGESYIFVVSPDSDWKAKLHYLDPGEEVLIPYTVVEAKGQEFDAIIWVHPFAGCGHKLEPIQLFEWYTTITRARNYQVWLLSERERDWLQQQAQHWTEPLEELFQDQSLPLAELIQELRQAASTQLTLDQRRERLIQQCCQDLYAWLSNGTPPTLPSTLPRLDWDFWQLLAAFAATEPDLDVLEKYSFSSVSLPVGDPLVTVMVYWVSRAWGEQTGLELPAGWEDQGRQALGDYLQQHPEQQPLALAAGDPGWQSFVYWALGQSWQAALHVHRHWGGSHNRKNQAIIRAISHHWEQQGLVLEAQRLRVSLGLEAPPAELPFLWDPPGPSPTTATRLCHQLVQTLQALSEPAHERPH
ncbi:MAG: AAA family ATPase [Thermostichales cyanobacterium SRBZ-1_bins_19]